MPYVAMSEAEYMRLYDVLDGHVDAAIGCFYTDVVLNGYAADNRSVFAFLNRNAAFWNLHRYSLQSTCFMILGRIFDTASDAHSIHALLAATIQHPEFFSKEALRQRKISLVHGTPDWLEDRVNEAWEPTTSELRSLKKALAPHRAKFQALYAPIRNQVFGHSIVTDHLSVQALFANASIPDIEALLFFLRDLLSNLQDLFLNGHQPKLGLRTYSYRERIADQVRRVLEDSGLTIIAPVRKSDFP